MGGGGAPAINNDTIGCGFSARREEEQSSNTTQLMTERLDPERREEHNEQQHTRQEESGLIEYETISRTAQESQTDNYSLLSNGDSNVANQGSEEHFTRGRNDAMIVNENFSNGSSYVSPSTVN